MTTAAGHARLAFLAAVASMCWMAVRLEAAVSYADVCQTVLISGRAEVPFGVDGLIAVAHLTIRALERYVEVSHAQLARGRDTYAFARSNVVMLVKVADFAA